jgi:hypothetical protein
VTEIATCPHCRTPAEVPDRFAGGIVNCKKCGRAIEVPGLRDPLWWLLRAGVVVAAIAIGVLIAQRHGPATGALTGIGLLAGSWLVSRVL